MKITVELTDAEVKGLKDYLSEVDGIKAGKKEITEHLQSLVNNINAPQEASSDYIRKYIN